MTKEKIFKLVCGAGNEDELEVEKLVMVYSLAGCQIFDVSADIGVIKSAKRGIARAGILKDRYICVSVGISGDKHFKKACIDESKCSKCLKCIDKCPQTAISVLNDSSGLDLNKKKCIGCQMCIDVCPQNCITMKDSSKNIEQLLPAVIDEKINCIELHAACRSQFEIIETWEYLNSHFDGMLSICLDRSKLGNDQIINLLVEILKTRKDYSTIIQTDGAPMSGGCDDYKSTLQSVAFAEIVRDKNFPAFILLSGGTNSKSLKLANLCGVDVSGAAVGSFARKLVKKYIDQDDLLENKQLLDEAVLCAKKFIADLFDTDKI